MADNLTNSSGGFWIVLYQHGSRIMTHVTYAETRKDALRNLKQSIDAIPSVEFQLENIIAIGQARQDEFKPLYPVTYVPEPTVVLDRPPADLPAVLHERFGQ